MMDSLQNDDRLDFIKSVFALTGAFNGIEIDEEKVVCEFLELDREGYVCMEHMTVGDDEKKGYLQGKIVSR